MICGLEVWVLMSWVLMPWVLNVCIDGSLCWFGVGMVFAVGKGGFMNGCDCGFCDCSFEMVMEWQRSIQARVWAN